MPIIESRSTHVFYIFPLVIDTEKLQVSRKCIADALKAEGVEGIVEGYTNIHLLPIYQKKIAYGKNHFPWLGIGANAISYEKGICPVAEKLHEESYLSFLISLFNLSENEIVLIAQAFMKVWKKLNLL